MWTALTQTVELDKIGYELVMNKMSHVSLRFQKIGNKQAEI